MIRINVELWRVRIVPPQHPALYRNGNPAIGCCDDNVKTIFISNILTQREMKKVLCHEIVHAAMFSYNVFLDYQQEELLANIIATYGGEIINITDNMFKRLRTCN